MSVIVGHASDLYIQTGSSTAFTTEACSQVAGTTYQITDAAKRQWDEGETVLVYDDGVLQTSGYKIHGACGRIVFDAAPTTPVTVSGKYYDTAHVAACGGWKLDLKSGVVKTSGINEVRTFQGTGLLDWGGSFSKLEEDDTYAALVLDNSGAALVLKMYESKAAPVVWIGYIVPEGWSLDNPDEAGVSESLSFKGTGYLDFLTSES